MEQGQTYSLCCTDGNPDQAQACTQLSGNNSGLAWTIKVLVRLSHAGILNSPSKYRTHIFLSVTVNRHFRMFANKSPGSNVIKKPFSDLAIVLMQTIIKNSRTASAAEILAFTLHAANNGMSQTV